jgi:hypothetical protein
MRYSNCSPISKTPLFENNKWNIIFSICKLSFLSKNGIAAFRYAA